MDFDPRDPAERRDTDQRLQTVRALLAKAEATDFPEEAKAFTRKAEELMARYAIEESSLWASTDADRRDTPIQVLVTLFPPYVAVKSLLVQKVADACGCDAVRFSTPGQRTEHVAVVGFETDCRFVEVLVTSLFVQVAAAMAACQPAGMTSAQTASWRRSFLTGFADEVAERLRNEREAAREAAAPVVVGERVTSMSVVIADRRSEVREELKRRYPHVRITRVSVGSSRHGRDAGGAAGRRADLGHRRMAPRPALGT